ncbi:hypothetical protein RRH01S_15_00030 [Rhizobium rhizogenes NBRC 13257]|uniref:Uncharacterized protein n=1 Tax=Rhizobium rhizogenes NBRC 13257 TaxID=1220581 RepID=A0AA87QEY6_RHIRH|nr:hypothetical protein RRH01S_15_00030 [Rhizobium rhizogenes NBRC 13257]
MRLKGVHNSRLADVVVAIYPENGETSRNARALIVSLSGSINTKWIATGNIPTTAAIGIATMATGSTS